MIQCRRGLRTVVEEWQDIVYKTTVYVLIGFSGKLRLPIIKSNDNNYSRSISSEVPLGTYG